MQNRTAEERAAVFRAVKNNSRQGSFSQSISAPSSRTDQEEPVKSYFKWRLFISILLLTGYIFMDMTGSKVLRFSSKEVKEVISYQVDTEKLSDYAKKLGIAVY